MLKSKKFIGMPVISLEEGQRIGKIKELVVNPTTKVVVALLIEQKGWFKDQKFIPYSKVCSVGNDAITIEQSSSVQKGTSLPDIVQLTKNKFTIIGCKVIAENGTVLGVVEEFFVDAASGQIVGLEISGSFINSLLSGRAFLDVALVRTIGKDLIVTSNEASDNLVKITGGLKETVLALKSTGDNLLENTLAKTKELTSGINKRWDEIRKERAKKSDASCRCEHGEKDRPVETAQPEVSKNTTNECRTEEVAASPVTANEAAPPPTTEEKTTEKTDVKETAETAPEEQRDAKEENK